MGKRITLTDEQLEDLQYGDSIPGFEVIDETEWQDHGKYQSAAVYFVHEGTTYQLGIGRAGSHFSHWHYESDAECVEVEKREKTVTYWAPVP